MDSMKTKKLKTTADATAILQEAFLTEIAKGAGHTFSAESIVKNVSDRLPRANVSKRAKKLIGAYFQKFKGLKVIAATNQSVISSRPNHDSQRICVWKVCGVGSGIPGK